MKERLKIGVVGLGGRGHGMLKDNVLKYEDIDVVAVCDVYPDRIEQGAQVTFDAKGMRPMVTTDYHELLANPDVEAILIFTAWEPHIEIAIAAMKAGIATAVEVGGAYSIRDCWDLVRTYEETKTPFMFLENCCFDKTELMATAMARKGLFGEIVHCQGAYGHDLRGEIAKGKENRHYRLRNYLYRNCENYPTHELGPIAKLLDINRGNRMVSLVSVASKSVGMEQYVQDHKDTVNPELIGKRFNQGDVVHTIITCANGETILLKLDTTLPRFYDREFTVRGTKGLYMQSINAAFIDDVHKDAAVTSFVNNAKVYEEEFLPDMWKNITPEQIKAGHGGMDGFELRAFVDACKSGLEMPIDVYDAASWMCVSCLSEESIQKGGAPVAIPDFLNGKWTNRPRKDVIDFSK